MIKPDGGNTDNDGMAKNDGDGRAKNDGDGRAKSDGWPFYM